MQNNKKITIYNKDILKFDFEKKLKKFYYFWKSSLQYFFSNTS